MLMIVIAGAVIVIVLDQPERGIVRDDSFVTTDEMDVIGNPSQAVRESDIKHHAPPNGSAILGQDTFELRYEVRVVTLTHIHARHERELGSRRWFGELEVDFLMRICLEGLSREAIDLNAF